MSTPPKAFVEFAHDHYGCDPDDGQCDHNALWRAFGPYYRAGTAAAHEADARLADENYLPGLAAAIRERAKGEK